MSALPTPPYSNDDSACELYATWSGHRHPVRPQSPLQFTDLSRQKVFYRAEFDQLGAERRLRVFEKFRVNTRPLAGVSGLSPSVASYEAIGPEDGIHAGAPLAPDRALAARRWIVYIDDSPEKGAQLVEIERLASTSYTYHANGEVMSVAIDDALGSWVVKAE